MQQPTAPDLETLAEAADTVDRLVVPDHTLAAAVATRLDDETRVVTPEQAVGAVDAHVTDRLDRLLEEVEAPVRALQRAITRCELGWRYHGDVTALASTELHDRVAAMADTWPEATLEEADPMAETVACLDRAGFDPLQASILPEGATVIEGTDRPQATHSRIGSVTEGVQTIKAIAADDPASTAVLAHPALHPQLEAILGAAGLTDTTTTDRPAESALIELLEAAASPGESTLGNVRRVLADLGIDRTGIEDHRPLGELQGETVVWLQAVTNDGAGLTIDELRRQFEFRRDGPLSMPAIDVLGVGDQPPTRSIVNDLRSYLEVTTEAVVDTADGVVVLDATSSWGTDRPRLLALVDSRSWCRPAPAGLGDDWSDRERHRVAQLLATGSQCTIVTTVDDPPIAGWLDSTVSDTDPRLDTVDRRPIAFSPEGRPRGGHDRFTKTTLNRLLTSPRDTQFGAILPRPERRALTRGSAIHDYADMLVAAPAAVEAIGRDRICEWIAEQVMPFVPTRRQPLVQARLEAAMTVVERYLADVTPPSEALSGFQSPRWMENTLAEAFEVAIDRSVTEQYFVDEELGVSGVVDLVHTPTHLVDFKTGSPRSRETIVAKGRVPVTTQTPDIQLPLYLTALRRRRGDEPLAMTFVYCHGHLPASLVGHPTLTSLSQTIRYESGTATETMTDPDVIDRLAAAVPATHPRARVCSVLPRGPLVAALEEPPIAAIDDIADLATENGLEESVAAAGARSLVRGLEQFRRTTLFTDDLDRFERFLQDWHDRRDRYDQAGYPLGDPPEPRLEFPRLHVDLSPLIGGQS